MSADTPNEAAYRWLRTMTGAFAGGDLDAPRFEAAARAGASHATPAIWSALVDEAEHHSVAPLVGTALADIAKRDATLVPPDVLRAFAVLGSRRRRASAEQQTCVDDILRAFGDAGLRVVLLKGACLGHLIYRAPADRPMTDIDILVDGAEADRAAALARTLGFAFADRHVSRFAGRMHHLPSAQRDQNGFAMSLEIHTDALAPDDSGSLTLAACADALRPFSRGERPAGLAFGHIDTLHHLTRHALEPARRLRLIHLLDIVRYRTAFRGEIDGERLARERPGLAVALDMIDMVFSPDAGQRAGNSAAAGVGHGMTPLVELLNERPGVVQTLRALLAPPPWWLHAYYGVPATGSLAPCRLVRHPARVAGWIARRLLAVTAPAAINKGVAVHRGRAT